MHQYKGKLIIHTGSMFSGKTSSLEKDVNRFRIAKYKTVAFKPVVDTRYSTADIVTHDKIYLNAVLVHTIEDIVSYIEEDEPDVIAIDEVQFLGGSLEQIVSQINLFLERDITVVLAGLDMDYMGRPFEIIKELMPYADYLYKHHAVCAGCGTDAWVSNRISDKEQRIIIGAVDEYEPLCRKCFLEEKTRR